MKQTYRGKVLICGEKGGPKKTVAIFMLRRNGALEIRRRHMGPYVDPGRRITCTKAGNNFVL